MILQESHQGQYFLTIPKRLVEAKGWTKGQTLKFMFSKRGNLEIIEV